MLNEPGDSFTRPDSSSTSKWTPENIEHRLRTRAERQARVDVLVEREKLEANQFYRAGMYERAGGMYASLLQHCGFRRAILSNYAACLLKFQHFDRAEIICTEVLKMEPKNIKLRFRRAMARKALKMYNAALIDLQTILALDPVCQDALSEHRVVLSQLRILGSNYKDPEMVEVPSVVDPAFPAVDTPGYPDEEVESDSEDFVHAGNGTACQKYNHGACTKGRHCVYSHAADFKSQRDKLGRNVCNYYLLGRCPLADDQCAYIHDKTYLPDGWWNDKRAIDFAETLFGDGELEPHDFEEALTPMLATYGRPREYPLYRKFDRLTPFRRRPGTDSEDPAVIAQAMRTPKSGFVMIVALTNDIDFPFKRATLEAINNKIAVKLVTTKKEALRHLDDPELKGVFLPDSRIHMPKKADLLARVVQYAKDGGRVVMGGSFSGEISPAAMDNLFQDSWGLPWKFGDYFRATFTTNIANELVRENANLVQAYSMKAVHLHDVSAKHAAYHAINDGRWESMVFPPFPVTNHTETPVAFTKMGKGYLGYVGDVNWEAGSLRVTLAMLDLINAPPRPNVRPLVILSPEDMIPAFDGEWFADGSLYCDSEPGGGEGGEGEDDDEEDDDDDDYDYEYE